MTRTPLASRKPCPRGGVRALLAASAIFAAGPFVVLSACGSGRDRNDFNSPGPDSGGERAVELPEAHAVTACGEAARLRAPLGCEYGIVAVDHGNGRACTAVLASNPGDRPARLGIRRGDKALPLTDSARLIAGAGGDPVWGPLVDDTLPPGASAVIALVEGSSGFVPGLCPIPPLDIGVAFLGRDDENDFFQLTSSEPVFATYFYGYGLPEGMFATSSSALRAVGSWGSQYIDVGVLEPGRPDIQEDALGRYDLRNMAAYAAFLAVEPSVITFTSDGGTRSEMVRAGAARRVSRDDLFIGTRFSSDHPIGLVVGAPVALMPYNVGAGDNIISHVSALDSWGTEYAAVGYPPRRPGLDDPALFRIIAAGSGTRLTYDPIRPVGAPERLGEGELAVFTSSTPFVVRSQDSAHPFYVSVAMTGGVTACEIVPPSDEDLDAGKGETVYRNCLGDPELVAVPAPSEFATRFAFVAPHHYPAAHLVLVRKRAKDGEFADVTLDCAGVVEGWTPIDSAGQYQTVTLPLSLGNYAPQVYPGGSCGIGPHTMSSRGPMSGFLWGWGQPDVIDGDDGRARSYGFALYGIDPERLVR